MIKGKNEKSQRGASIIELTIAGLIVAIGVTASIPAIGRNLRLYRTEVAVRMVSQRLMEAKLTAIKWNRNARLVANPNDNTLEIRTTDNSGNDIATRLAAPLPDEAAILSGSTVSIVFNSLGRKQSGTEPEIVLGFGNSKQCRKINVLPTGKLSVAKCDYSVENQD